MSLSTSGVTTGATGILNALKRALQKKEDDQQKLQEELTSSLSGENEIEDEANVDTFEAKKADSKKEVSKEEVAKETAEIEAAKAEIEEEAIQAVEKETAGEDKSVTEDIKEIFLRDDLTAAQKLAYLAAYVLGKNKKDEEQEEVSEVTDETEVTDKEDEEKSVAEETKEAETLEDETETTEEEITAETETTEEEITAETETVEEDAETAAEEETEAALEETEATEEAKDPEIAEETTEQEDIELEIEATDAEEETKEQAAEETEQIEAEETKPEETAADETKTPVDEIQLPTDVVDLMEETIEIEDNDTPKAGSDKKDDKKVEDVITDTDEANIVRDWLNGVHDIIGSDDTIPDEMADMINDTLEQLEEVLEDYTKVLEDMTNEVNSANVEIVKSVAEEAGVEVDESDLVGNTVGEALEVIAEVVETQMYERHVYSTRVSKHTDSASVKENTAAISEFMKSYNEAYEQTCDFNAEFLSLTDESNFKNAEQIAKRLRNNQYIITKELKKATTSVQSVQISTVKTDDKVENKYNEKGLHVLSKLQNMITLDDSAEQNTEDDILTKDEYMEMQQDFIDAQDKSVAYTILLNDAKKYGVMQSEAVA